MEGKPRITAAKVAAMIAAVGMSLSASIGAAVMTYVFAALMWACLYWA